MILRRSFLAGAASFAVLPVIARADISRVTFSNSLEQGSLVIGKAPGAARVSVDGTNALLSADGEFVFGFAYDQTKSATVALMYNDGTRETRVIAPVVRQYEVQAINGVPEKFVTPSPDQLARIKREGDAIVQARTRDTAQTFFDGGFDWPIAGIITSLFGSRRVLNGVPKSPHLGVDIAAGRRHADPRARAGNRFARRARLFLRWRHHADRSWPRRFDLLSASEQIAGERGRCGEARADNRTWWGKRGSQPAHICIGASIFFSSSSIRRAPRRRPRRPKPERRAANAERRPPSASADESTAIAKACAARFARWRR